MADPTAVINHTYKNSMNREVVQAIIKTSEALVNGGHVAIDQSTGKMEFMDDSAGLIPAGIYKGPVQGDTSTGDGTIEGVGKGGQIHRLSVTGASAITDFSKFVYATDGQTYTLTRPADDAVPIGIVLQWDTSTYCWVYVFSLVDAVMFSTQASGGTKKNVCLGVVPSTALEGTAAIDLLTNQTQYGHFTIDSFYAVTQGYDTGLVAGDQDLNLEIGTTDVTGGVLTLGFGDADAAGDAGAITAATAITAANEVHDGDTLSVEMAASGTGFTADKFGLFELWMTISPLPGA